MHGDPFSDEGGLFGFRMQELYNINVDELAKRLDELKEAIRTVHRAGVVINDVSISNVMRDAEDNIRLIDFGFAGRIGHKVPAFFPPWKSPQSVFSIETDNKGFEEIVAICKESALRDEALPLISSNICSQFERATVSKARKLVVAFTLRMVASAFNQSNGL